MRGYQPPMPGRGLVIAVLVLTQACAAGREALVIENWDDLDATRLGLVPGKSTLAEAEAAMRAAKLTGVTSQTWADDGRAVSVLAADYQLRVFVFEAGRFRQSLPVDTGAVLPFRWALRVGRAEGRLALVAMYRDPREELSAAGSGPRAAVFLEEAEGFRSAGSVALGGLAATHGGLTRPLLVGDDFSRGVMFVARDREGAPWSSAYLLSLRGKSLVLAPLPMDEAMRCACVHDWVYGR